MKEKFADRLISYYKSLKPPKNLPKGIGVLYPQEDPNVVKLVTQFYKKFFNDSQPKSLMLGINPGRLGAGITGVNFTAPRQLKENCGMDHPFGDSSELSAEFIYEMIDSYGGPATFYSNWFIGSVCPLGFVQKGKNINYYDDKKLQAAVTPFIIDSINRQVQLGFNHEICPCIGGEKNFKFLQKLNDEHEWFRKIVPLPHPRFIMQYRRREKEKYIHQYLSVLRLAG